MTPAATTRRASRRSAIEFSIIEREHDAALDFVIDNVPSEALPSMDVQEMPCIIGFARKHGFTGQCSACRGCPAQPKLA